MTSKNKPAIHPGDPGGIPVPKSVDGVEIANQIIKQKVEGDNVGRAKYEAGIAAQTAANRVRDLSRVLQLSLEELVETDIPFRGRPIHTTPDGRYWVLVAGVSLDPISRPFDAVTIGEVDGYKDVIAHWKELSKREVEENQVIVDREKAETAEIEAADAELRMLIHKTVTYHVLPQGSTWIGMRQPTLTEVLKLIEETGAEVELRPYDVFLVRAASEAQLFEAAAKLKNPPRFLSKRIKGHDGKVQLLIYLLEELKPLSIEWKKTGKIPLTDSKQPADSLASNGAFVA